MKYLSILSFLILISNIQAQNQDTIFSKTEVIPCDISFIYESNVFYKETINRREKSAHKQISEIVRIVIYDLSKPSILINDSSLYRAIIAGEEIPELQSFAIEKNIENKIIEESYNTEENLSLLDQNSITQDVNTIQLNLFKSHEQYRKGTGLLISGFSLSIIGTALLMTGIEGNDKGSTTIGSAFSIIGGIVSMTGVIVQIDSHKYIGRASNRR